MPWGGNQSGDLQEKKGQVRMRPACVCVGWCLTGVHVSVCVRVRPCGCASVCVRFVCFFLGGGTTYHTGRRIAEKGPKGARAQWTRGKRSLYRKM